MPGERPVFLILTSDAGNAKFIIPESIEDGYTNDLQANATEHRTHPAQHLWKGGRLNTMSVVVPLVVGVSYGIDVPRQLVTIVETLYDMALASERTLNIVTLIVTGSGQTWFTRKGFVKDVKAKFETPVDISTGMPLRAQLSFTFEPSFVDGYSYQAADARRLPRRPFDFSRA